MFQRIILLFLLPVFAYSQNINPPRGRVYNDSVLISIFISISPDSLALLYKPGNECSNHEFPVTFIWSDGINPNDTLQNVGIRFKGNTSRLAQKKSFKLSFNTFKAGRNFYDVEKLNLNGEHNDPSVIREKLFWDAMYQNNSPALRCNYVKLFVNGSYFGLYINVENLDEIFTQSRFGNSEGNLYKCYYGADLTYKGINGNFYKNTGSFCGQLQRVYELQNNANTDNYQDLADFINALNNLPTDTAFARKIKKYFNVESYLKILALEIASGHWDNYVSNNNNYFLYKNIYTSQIEYISYDADNTFGIGWSGDDWGTKNVYQFNGGKNRPLYTRLLAVPEFKNKFDYYLNSISSGIYDTAAIYPRIDALHNQIWTAAVSDTFRPKDYGFTVGQFHNSFNQTIGISHVKYGLKPFFLTRANSIKQQVSHNNIIPVLIQEKHIPLLASVSDSLKFSIHAYDDDSPILVIFHHSYDPAQSFISDTMYDDGLHDDHYANDGVFGFTLAARGAIDTLVFFYTAVSISNQISRYPADNNILLPIGVRSNLKLSINELMAKNTITITDEFHEYDDWLEIYNNESSGINLGTLYLSNSLSDPFKFQLPTFTLKPDSFKLLWCDNQTSQGIWHTNFKISAGGEWLGLFDSQGLLIDSTSFMNLGADLCYGRRVDGTGAFGILSNRTPGYTNNGFSYGLKSNHEEELKIFPNPANTKLNIHSISVNNNYFILINSLGQIILQGQLSERETVLDISGIPPGFYFIKYGDLMSEKIMVLR